MPHVFYFMYRFGRSEWKEPGWKAHRDKWRRFTKRRDRVNDALRDLGALPVNWELQRLKGLRNPQFHGGEDELEFIARTEREWEQLKKIEKTTRRYRKLRRRAKKLGMSVEEYALRLAAEKRKEAL